ncbi:hypothetical protein ACH50O_06725 [Methylomonas sp. 2BW1-5-20]|uniref:hypothetical protein n=1 Tax=Methylomonas sp. 2BW1-5-20 TaxID=3376686 RepID=UPI00404CC0AA
MLSDEIDSEVVTSLSYKLPKKVFGLYKSASLHTKQERKLPVQLYVLAACVVLMIVIGSRFKTRYGHITASSEVAVASPAPARAYRYETPAVPLANLRPADNFLAINIRRHLIAWLSSTITPSCRMCLNPRRPLPIWLSPWCFPSCPVVLSIARNPKGADATLIRLRRILSAPISAARL